MTHNSSKPFDELKLTGKLPTPAGVGMQILKLTQTDDFSADDISRTIATDPALTGRVLKMANSAVSATIKAVVTVQDALVRLGVRVVRNVALSFSLISSYRDGTCRAFDYSRFWSEALLQGVAASAVARLVRLANPPEAYVVGLLRDIGRLAFACVHPEKYASVIARAIGMTPAQVATIEIETFAITHSDLAEAMVRDWGLPQAHCIAIGLASTPEKATQLRDEGAKKLSEVLRLSRLLADACLASEGTPVLEATKTLEQALAKYKIDPAEVKKVVEDVTAEWKGWGDALGIVARSAGQAKPVAPQKPAPQASAVPSPAAAPQANTAREAAPAAVPAPVKADVLPKVAPPPMTVTAAIKLDINATVERASATAAAVTEKLARQERPMRIVAVDDDNLSLTVLARHLSAAGHTVWTAKNGNEALALILEKAPQVVVSDWNMPEMDGIELCRAMRRYDAGRRIYVILLTGTGDEDRIVEAFDAGIDDYIVKPFKPRLLLARIRASERVVSLQEQVEADSKIMERQVAELAVLNRKFQEMSHTDALTGLYNRRYAMQRLHEEWANFQRKSEPFALIMIDIDHFKSVNDSFGHDAGDAVLAATAKLLRSQCRENEIVCRLGGEEFVVICPAETIGGAAACAERLRHACESTIVSFKTFNRSVTLSLGVSETCPQMQGADDVLKAADEAVYRAKESGRNRVCVTQLAPV